MGWNEGVAGLDRTVNWPHSTEQNVAPSCLIHFLPELQLLSLVYKYFSNLN